MFASGTCSASNSGRSCIASCRRWPWRTGGRRAPRARGTVALERHPDLEGVEPSRALEAPRPLIPGTLARRVEQVRRVLRESGLEVAFVAHEHDARRQRHQHHLVRIPRDRARAMDACDACAMGRREQGRRAVGAVHVEPHVVRLAQPADRLEVVEGSVAVVPAVATTAITCRPAA